MFIRFKLAFFLLVPESAAEAWNWYTVTSAIFYWPKQVTRAAQIQGMGIDTAYLERGIAKLQVKEERGEELGTLLK